MITSGRFILLISSLSTVAYAFASLPAPAQNAAAVPPRPSQPPPKARLAVAGLPILTSDGKEIGKVLTMGTDEDGLAVLVGEIERAFGIGSVAVAIPTDMFVLITDRIVLSITEAEVSQRLARADRGR
jgi:sporulation protein YlmC with PRC-barrel domain